MVVCDEHLYIRPKVEGLRRIIRSPVLKIVPGVRAGQVNRSTVAVGEVVRMVRRGPQRSVDWFFRGHCPPVRRAGMNWQGRVSQPRESEHDGLLVHWAMVTRVGTQSSILSRLQAEECRAVRLAESELQL